MSDSNLYTEILKFEAMNDTQLANLKSNYVEMIIDGMDMKTMEALVYDMLIESYELYSEDDMKDEIVDSYGEEILEDLMS
jgi:hypothetical protein